MSKAAANFISLRQLMRVERARRVLVDRLAIVLSDLI
jgi:hypothetical protein